MNPASAPELQEFWIPVAQIVPIFALAWVLEARRVASKWRAEVRFARYLQTAEISIVAFILVATEVVALSAMATGATLRAARIPAVIGLSIVIAGMCVAPIVEMVSRGTFDLVLGFINLLPKSRWRKRREWLRGSAQLAVKYRDECTKIGAAIGEQYDLVFSMAQKLREKGELGAHLSQEVKGLFEAMLGNISGTPASDAASSAEATIEDLLRVMETEMQRLVEERVVNQKDLERGMLLSEEIQKVWLKYRPFVLDPESARLTEEVLAPLRSEVEQRMANEEENAIDGFAAFKKRVSLIMSDN